MGSHWGGEGRAGGVPTGEKGKQAERVLGGERGEVFFWGKPHRGRQGVVQATEGDI